MREILGTANQTKTNEMTRDMPRDEDKAKSKDVPQMKERRIIGLIRIRQRRKAKGGGYCSKDRAWIVYLSVPSQGLGLYPNKDSRGVEERASTESVVMEKA